MEAFIGIDVACAKDKYCPISICIKTDGKLVPLSLATELIQPPKGLGNIATLEDTNNVYYASAVKAYILSTCETHDLSPACIAIDSPMRPRESNIKRRYAEVALDKQNISCYTTPSVADFDSIIVKGKAHLQNGGELSRLPHSMQIFMLAGFSIAQALKNVAPVIEVYPHATAKLLGTAGKHKSKDDQAKIQLQAISKYTGWPSTASEWADAQHICKGPMHDKVDAYSAAWIASLLPNNRMALGNLGLSDAIWLPKLDSLPTFEVFKYIDLPAQNKSKPKSSVETQNNSDTKYHQRLCPACNKFLFKRWPFGWDAHAAHKCAGINGVDLNQRKSEFKRRFM